MPKIDDNTYMFAVATRDALKAIELVLHELARDAGNVYVRDGLMTEVSNAVQQVGDELERL